MLSKLANVAVRGPAIYYSLGIANTLVMPSIIKYQSGPSLLAQDAFPEVFKKVEELRKDILIYNAPNLPHAASLGTNFGPSAVLLMNDELLLTDREAANFICKHELSHINTSDGFIACVLAIAAATLSAYAVPYLQSRLPWWAAPISYCIPLVMSRNVYSLAMCVFEYRADMFALRHATSEELVAIERFVRGEIEVNKTLQAKYPRLFSADGNIRWTVDAIHPPVTTRLKLIRWECQERGIVIDESAETEKMQKIKEFHQNAYRKFLKLQIDL